MADAINNTSLRRLSRRDLLELLVELSEENDRLTARVAELESQLADRELQVRDAGSLAQVAAEVSGLLLAAQETADLYLKNLPYTNDAVATTEAAQAPHDAAAETDVDDVPHRRGAHFKVDDVP